MTYRFSVNNAYISTRMGPDPLFDMKTLMVAHGWTVARSNNGATAGAADNITTSADLESQFSWMVLHHGVSGREWLFGMDADVTFNEWYVGYSAVAGFTGGSTTVMPTATDESAVGNPLASTPRDLFPLSDSYCHMMVDDASSMFYMLTVLQSNHLVTGCIAGDVVTQAHASDVDKYVALAHHESSSTGAFSGTNGPWGSGTSLNFSRGWYNHPTGSAERMYALGLCTSMNYLAAPASTVTGAGVSPYDGNDQTFPVIWGRTSNFSAPTGIKGFSSLFRNVSTQRGRCDLLTVGADRQIMTGTVLGAERNVSLPWHPTTIPL